MTKIIAIWDEDRGWELKMVRYVLFVIKNWERLRENETIAKRTPKTKKIELKEDK